MILALVLATTYLLTEWRMSTTVKTCFKCNAEKPITEFYVHPRMEDGRLNKCKACARRDVQENREKNIDYYREYDRKRGRRPGDPLKEKARAAIRHAIHAGKLKRGKCAVGKRCKGKVEAHHEDYSKPMEIIWLCKRHHSEVHTREEAA